MTVRSIEPHPPAEDARREDTPCAGAYAAFTRVYPDLRITVSDSSDPALEPGSGWLTTARLIAEPALRARLFDAEARHGLARYGEPLRPDVAAGFWLHRYTWPLCLLFTLPWFLERRVPLLPVERVASRRAPGGGGPAELAVRPTGFACLPGDPAAALPGARVVPDEAALAAELRAGVAGHLAPLLAACRRDLRRGPRTLWGLATDELVEGLWYAGSLLGEEARAVAALDALLPGHPTLPGEVAPFTGAAAFRTAAPAQPGAAPTRSRTRVSCCLYYTVQPADACVGCPRTCC